MSRIALLSRVLAGAIATLAAVSAVADDALVARGKYLVSIMDCTGCHTPGSLTGEPDFSRFLAGSTIGFGMGPVVEGGGPTGGTVFPPNLTPDPQTGLGDWSDDEIKAAVTAGQSRDGRQLSPVMPWPSYASLTAEDADALVAFLRTIPAVSHQPPPPAAPGEKPAGPYLTLRGD